MAFDINKAAGTTSLDQWVRENAPQTSKDAPRTYELSKEDIDLIKLAFAAWYGSEYTGHVGQLDTIHRMDRVLEKFLPL